ncbi:MAG: DNA (cytosine-5-)-methyltransferase [Alphaproteobacteria bacterium]|nr:DNA (cytosine-5-)-methyltransferase [Alphaproteobacteria bacterium]
MKYKTIDLCAGIGGIRKGFEMTGKFENVLSAEIDASACRTYQHLFGENPFNDITDENFKEKVSKTKYDVLLAGFPCQSFSRAGLQLGFRDTTKGTIFFDIADIISRTQPKAIFLENVENLVSHDKGDTLNKIITTLEDELRYRIIGVNLGDDGDYVYTRDSFVRNSKHFGLPQNRPRVYIMGFSKKIYGNAVKLLTKELPRTGKKVIAEDLNDILDSDVDDFYYMSSGYLETLKRHKQRETLKGNGFGYVIVNDDRTKKVVANTVLATGGSGKERNLIRQFKPGISGKRLSTKKTPLNSENIRVMTPLEWGKLQGFINYAFIDSKKIDKFSFPENTSIAQQYKQFGNSVTIPVIEEMARFMIECFDIMTQDQLTMLKNIIKEKANRKILTCKEVMETLHVGRNRAKCLLDTIRKTY